MSLVVPGPPQNVAVDGLTSFGLYILWQPPADDGGSPILRYVIRVNDTDVEAGGTDRSLIIRSSQFLMLGTNYEYVSITCIYRINSAMLTIMSSFQGRSMG